MSLCVTCELLFQATWAGTGGLVLKRLGRWEHEKRGKMRGYHERRARIVRQAEEVTAWERMPLAPSLEFKIDTGSKWVLHLGLGRQPVIPISQKCPFCSKTWEHTDWARSGGGRGDDKESDILHSWLEGHIWNFLSDVEVVSSCCAARK